MGQKEIIREIRKYLETKVRNENTTICKIYEIIVQATL